MFIALAVLAALVLMAPPSPSSLLKVSFSLQATIETTLTLFLADSKQARDLIGVLKESNQQIDPRLSEMGRFGGGGGGSGRYGRGRGGGGRGGGRGSGSYASPSMLF
jgi:hypothetical protein